jgi:hypothetical protein
MRAGDDQCHANSPETSDWATRSCVRSRTCCASRSRTRGSRGLLDPDGEPAAALEGLERATGFLRGRLGKALKVRHVPELRFTHDDSAEEGVRLSALIERTVPAEDQG